MAANGASPVITGNFSYPTKIKFGPGRLAELPAACADAKIKKPLIVTDPVLAGMPVVKEMLSILEGAGLQSGVFSDIRSNPVSENVEAGLKVFREGGYDGVIAFGGGSGLDTGKAIAFMAGQTRPMWDFEDIGDWWTRANPDGIAPIVAIPTTAGTGSEVGRASVITDEKTHTKKVIFHPKMQPSVVVADPALTVGLPKHLTAATGFDALAHCLEAYSAPGYHPMADGIAVEGTRLVKESLLKAYEKPDDMEARANMLCAAAMGATAFQKGLGAIHALSHPIGALYDSHHGLTNAVFMPYVLQFNRPVIEERMNRLAAYVGIENGFDGLLEWVLAMRKATNVPHTLVDLLKTKNVDASQWKEGGAEFEQIVSMALVDPTAGGNPIPMTAENTRVLLRRSLAGDLTSGTN
ncbi:alcohol dehydrogenase, class IV [Hyaloraphidium curvatum]|nr:alcohol dehydrogenase, class IV [Hyaloraphidium curvatum]